MEAQNKGVTPLFDVYLRLRPPTAQSSERFLAVELDRNGDAAHVTINPPHDDYRRRAIERYSFTKIFEEDASQLNVFDGADVGSLIQGALGSQEKQGKDGLLATLGVTGSGKSHTILGSKTQRGLTQMTLDVLFRNIGASIAQSDVILGNLAAGDVSEARLVTASEFVESIYGDGDSCVSSRAQTPLSVSTKIPRRAPQPSVWSSYKTMLGFGNLNSPVRSEMGSEDDVKTIRPVTGIARVTRSPAKTSIPEHQETMPTIIYPSLSKLLVTPSSKKILPRLSSFPSEPILDDKRLDVDDAAEYAIVLSMYEVYNNRICDLLNVPTSPLFKSGVKDTWKPALLFKSTEFSPDRKVVAGLRKIVCGSLEEALLVLEAGLSERTVAGTGSNATSSRSHGFFCIEINKRRKGCMTSWTGSTLTVADLAGSERARTANTYGTTLAEAGKINQSLMLLGQVMQASTGIGGAPTDPSLSKLAIRQCKLTELLFSNAFHHPPSSLALQQPRRQQQKAIMIVTADPRGDYNATSQILKYSALAKETTVPRIPSVTSTILTSSNPSTTTATSSTPSTFRHTSATTHVTSQPAPHTSSHEIARLTAELALARQQLEESTRASRELEASWARAEERLETIEAEVRDECWSSFEARLAQERALWAAAWDNEREQNEGHVDRKVEVLVRGIGGLDVSDAAAGIDGIDASTGEREGGEDSRDLEHLRDRVEELERENELLRGKITGLERERVGRTPSRKVKVLKARPWNVDDAENLSP